MAESLPLYRIVLTGGPCGGKSTALAHIAERLRGLGFRVYTAPEAATLMLGGGARVRGLSRQQLVTLQASILKVTMALEDGFIDVARSLAEPSVVIFDRGVMDAAAYLPDEDWAGLARAENWDVVALRDRRYDAVIHLVTAADGAERFYTTSNNMVRYETPEEARAVDARLRDAWVGHPRLRVIDNSTDFGRKVQRVVAAVCRVVGAPEPAGGERKFLVRRSPAAGAMPVRCEEFDVEQTYLLSADGSEGFVRRRGQNGSYTFTHTTRKAPVEGQCVEVEKQISGRDYAALAEQADPARGAVKKRRRVFLWANQYFELDTFLEPCAGLELLGLEVEAGRTVVLPPFIEVEREVTGESRYCTCAIASERDTG